MTGVRCGNPDCGRSLDELPRFGRLPPRKPCPFCGSEWLVLLVVMIVVGSVVGLFVGPVAGVLVSLALGVLGLPVGRRAETRIREIEHGGDR